MFPFRLVEVHRYYDKRIISFKMLWWILWHFRVCLINLVFFFLELRIFRIIIVWFQTIWTSTLHTMHIQCSWSLEDCKLLQQFIELPICKIQIHFKTNTFTTCTKGFINILSLQCDRIEFWYYDKPCFKKCHFRKYNKQNFIFASFRNIIQKKLPR